MHVLPSEPREYATLDLSEQRHRYFVRLGRHNWLQPHAAQASTVQTQRLIQNMNKELIW